MAVRWLWHWLMHVHFHLVNLMLSQMADLALVVFAELMTVWWNGLVHSVLLTMVDYYHFLTWLFITWLVVGLTES